ncbi:MAG: endonuclease/exonuclease/phosphatase family protein [Planctomycetota bacterium]
MSKATQLLCAVSALFVYIVVSSGCDPASNGPLITGSDPYGTATGQQGTTGNQPVSGTYPADYGGSGSAQPPTGAAAPIIVGSFNIQTFGQSKIEDLDAMLPIVEVTRKFDILAIQELRSKVQDVIPRFLDMVNANGSRYKAIVGPRQGYNDRTSNNRYFEQYVYVYDTERIEQVGDAYVADAPVSQIHRSPMVMQFRTKEVAPQDAFQFVLMNVHVDPDDVPTEHNVLTQIIDGVRRNHPYEDDFILLGDLNAAPRYFHSFPWFANQFAAIEDRWPTNTRGTRNIDNIVFDAAATNEYLNQSGVLNLPQTFGLTVQQATVISDHMPVWAVFSAYEQPQSMIVEDPRVVR